MGLRIGTNIASITAQRGLRKALAGVQRSFRLLSSGRRSAADDPAGASISARMRAEIRGLAQAVRNGHDGISMIQVAEGALGEVSDILIRMREDVLAINPRAGEGRPHRWVDPGGLADHPMPRANRKVIHDLPGALQGADQPG